MSVTARQIITSALGLKLNRLSPGETLEADLAALCLTGLNEIVDEWSAGSSMLWREVLASSTAPLTGVTGTLGVTWSQIAPGQSLLSATYNNGQFDYPISHITMEQYQTEVRNKTISGSLPQYWTYDGESTVYLYPAATGQTITLRVNQAMSEFVDLDTVYVMPSGYLAALSDVLAEKVAPAVLGVVPPAVASAARLARSRIATQNLSPGIISSSNGRGNILTGWR